MIFFNIYSFQTDHQIAQAPFLIKYHGTLKFFVSRFVLNVQMIFFFFVHDQRFSIYLADDLCNIYSFQADNQKDADPISLQVTWNIPKFVLGWENYENEP